MKKRREKKLIIKSHLEVSRGNVLYGQFLFDLNDYPSYQAFRDDVLEHLNIFVSRGCSVELIQETK